MKVRWTGEARALPDPQIEVASGDEVDVDDNVGDSLIDQGLAERVTAKASKKEND